MRILIISRLGEEVRRSFQARQLGDLNLPFEFLDAVEATELTADTCRTAADNWPSPTRRQDVACFLSHRRVWQSVIDHGTKTLILEDDAVLSDNIADILGIIETRDDAWNCAYDLEFAPRPHILRRRHAWTDKPSGFSATRIYQNRVGLAGYVIGPEAARRMLAETTQYSLIDAFFWHRPWLAAYQIEPAPVIQKRFLEDAECADFVRSDIDPVFIPRSRARKLARRLELEGTKAKNLIVGLIGGEKRNLLTDRTRFAEPTPT